MEDNSDKTDPASGIDYLKLIKKYEKYEYFKKTVDFSPGRVLFIIRRETTSLSDTTDKVGVCHSGSRDWICLFEHCRHIADFLM